MYNCCIYKSHYNDIILLVLSVLYNSVQCTVYVYFTACFSCCKLSNPIHPPPRPYLLLIFLKTIEKTIFFLSFFIFKNDRYKFFLCKQINWIISYECLKSKLEYLRGYKVEPAMLHKVDLLFNVLWNTVLSNCKFTFLHTFETI